MGLFFSEKYLISQPKILCFVILTLLFQLVIFRVLWRKHSFNHIRLWIFSQFSYFSLSWTNRLLPSFCGWYVLFKFIIIESNCPSLRESGIEEHCYPIVYPMESWNWQLLWINVFLISQKIKKIRHLANSFRGFFCLHLWEFSTISTAAFWLV